ncbi:MAG: NAD(P)H-dependent glycerol-3-phosphate dehydrogenase [Chitinophagales bacterium]|jgi:glycerol-3-phosphate dehydrogenase (NAD(P)+)|nr:NAD(P)H-dependent glycerol-3-phosphate dehydrogenase [Chitinophagales bacterium]
MYHITKPIGILGVGSFGTVLANLISINYPVILYARKQESLHNINNLKVHRDTKILDRIIATDDLKFFAESCDIILPIVPSYAFSTLIDELNPYLEPHHILIHGTKGFHVSENLNDPNLSITPKSIMTMSELIETKTKVYRVGCISGPNLSKEIASGQPAGAVIASKYNLVIDLGVQILKSHKFQMFKSKDIKGIELAGIFKNYLAIITGASSGMGYGINVSALLITKGVSEMIEIGKFLNVDSKSFLGLAGIGDLIATCNSPLSRNFSVGYRLAKGESLDQIIPTLNEAAEGINTIKVIYHLVKNQKLSTPLVKIMYKVMYEGFPMQRGLDILMRLSSGYDVVY